VQGFLDEMTLTPLAASCKQRTTLNEILQQDSKRTVQ
jgi:hypothetical protein